ncbi:hypothetical protein ACQ4WX_06540 [Streptomyces lasalocidi]
MPLAVARAVNGTDGGAVLLVVSGPSALVEAAHVVRGIPGGRFHRAGQEDAVRRGVRHEADARHGPAG